MNASRFTRITAAPMAMSSSWALRGPAISAVNWCCRWSRVMPASARRRYIGVSTNKSAVITSASRREARLR